MEWDTSPGPAQTLVLLLIPTHNRTEEEGKEFGILTPLFFLMGLIYPQCFCWAGSWGVLVQGVL